MNSTRDSQPDDFQLDVLAVETQMSSCALVPQEDSQSPAAYVQGAEVTCRVFANRPDYNSNRGFDLSQSELSRAPDLVLASLPYPNSDSGIGLYL